MFSRKKKQTSQNTPDGDIQRLSEIEEEIKAKMKRLEADSQVILNDSSKGTPELLNALELVKLLQEHRIITHRLVSDVDQRLKKLEVNDRRTD